MIKCSKELGNAAILLNDCRRISLQYDGTKDNTKSKMANSKAAAKSGSNQKVVTFPEISVDRILTKCKAKPDEKVATTSKAAEKMTKKAKQKQNQMKKWLRHRRRLRLQPKNEAPHQT